MKSGVEKYLYQFYIGDIRCFKTIDLDLEISNLSFSIFKQSIVLSYCIILVLGMLQNYCYCLAKYCKNK